MLTQLLLQVVQHLRRWEAPRIRIHTLLLLARHASVHSTVAGLNQRQLLLLLLWLMACPLHRCRRRLHRSGLQRRMRSNAWCASSRSTTPLCRGNHAS
jgi:hypothetical protein